MVKTMVSKTINRGLSPYEYAKIKIKNGEMKMEKTSNSKSSTSDNVEKIPAYVLRMKEELSDLIEKEIKLKKFINEDNPVYSKLNNIQKDLLKIQAAAMNTYADTLATRYAMETNQFSNNSNTYKRII